MTRYCSIAAVLAIHLPAAFSSAADIRFNRDVRPILSAHCFHGHGPDEGQRKADLRLDQQSGIQAAFAGGVSD
ncbi:MAG: hypothetical protein VB858_11895, partial [Planctomycetaceae bacterium]